MDATDIEVFISHASEDKEQFVRPPAEVLVSAGVQVWYDEFSLKIGDSLRASIDEGLARCRYAIVILSPGFLGKNWTKWELSGLVQRQLDEGDMMLPVWLDIDAKAIRRVSPPLADIVAIRAERGVDSVAAALIDRIRGEQQTTTIALLPSTVSAVAYFQNFPRPILTFISENATREIVTDKTGKRFAPNAGSFV